MRQGAARIWRLAGTAMLALVATAAFAGAASGARPSEVEKVKITTKLSNSGGRGTLEFTGVYGPNPNASQPKMVLKRLLHVRVRHIPYACTYAKDGAVRRASFPRIGIDNAGLGSEYFEAATLRQTHGWYVTLDATVDEQNRKLYGSVGARSPDDPSDECSTFFLDDAGYFEVLLPAPKR